MSQIIDMSVSELSTAIHSRKISAVEAAKAYIEQIQAAEPSVAAYITSTADIALTNAAQVDAQLAAGEYVPALAGIPAGIKDNIVTKGVTTTCASKMLENFVPPYDAAVMTRLHEQRISMLGKLNCDEFAMGSSTENSAFQQTHNPRALDRVPGGSSGGSAAAVAARECAFSLGSDTGGSIRQPAAFCGIVGMKPTYGTVSRNGLVAFASSLDQIGPLTRTVRDSALVLNAIAGHDALDATSIDRQYGDFGAQLEAGVRGMKLALPSEFLEGGIHADVKAAILAAARAYEALGAEVVEVKIPTLKYALPAYYVISSAEASSNLSRFDGVKYGYRARPAADSHSQGFESIDELYKRTRAQGFGSEVKRRIMLGSFALCSGYYDAYYKKALQARTLIMRDFDAAFEKCDAMLAPVAPSVAYKLGEKTQDALEMYMGDIYTVPVNVAGLPGLSMPCGVNAAGLPIGMQLIGKPFSEPSLYRIANAGEQAFGTYEQMMEVAAE